MYLIIVIVIVLSLIILWYNIKNPKSVCVTDLEKYLWFILSKWLESII